MLLDALAENYRKKQKRLADTMARKVTSALKLHNSPTGKKSLVAYMTKEILVANAKAANLARQYVNTARRAYDLTPIPLPANVEQDAEAIAQAVSTAFDEGPGSLTRLARSEPLWAAQRALSEAAVAMERGWVRHTGPTPCAICKRLADGKVRGPKVPMAGAHPNCSCVQVFTEEPWQEKKPRRVRKPKKAAAKKPTPKLGTRQPQKATRSPQTAKKAQVAKKATTARKPAQRRSPGR